MRGGTSRDGSWAWLAAGVVALLTLVTAFHNGGYFAGTTAVATTGALVLLLVRFMVAGRPVGGLTPGGLIGAAALAFFAGWVAISSGWSDSEARSIVELNRVLGYLAVFVVFASLRGGARSARLVLRLTAVALALAVVAGVLSRIAPDLVDSATSRLNARLSWPLGYWNAFGIAAGLTALLALHLASDARERLAVRIVAGALVPIACVGLYLTLSRGAIAATAVGLVVLVVLRGVPAIFALLATAAPAAWATTAAYDAELLVSVELSSPAALSQGRHLFGIVLAATAIAALLVGLMAVASARVGRPAWARTGRLRAVAGAAALAALIALTAAGLPGYVGDQWDELTASGSDALSPQSRERLSTVGTNGRTDQWQVALDSLAEDPLHGSGAGTFELTWARERPIDVNSRDAHSLYLETAAELGVVGTALLAVALLVPFALMVRRLGTDPVWSGAVAIAVTWLVHAGVDWDWEMPALTLWVFALLGSAVAERGWRLHIPYVARIGAGLVLLWLLLIPARIGLSQVELTRAAEDLRRGDCEDANAHAVIAARRLNARPEPLALLAFCDVRQDRPELAKKLIRAALQRDPGEWSLLYGAGLIEGATGGDPRPLLRDAVRANPREPTTREVLEAMDAAPRRAWPRLARLAPLPVVQPGRATQK